MRKQSDAWELGWQLGAGLTFTTDFHDLNPSVIEQLNEIINLGTEEDLKKLLKLGLPIKNEMERTPSIRYSNPLETALEYNRVDMFRLLVNAGYSIHAKSYWPTLLFHTQDYYATKYLLDNGLDPLITDNQNRNAFEYWWKKFEEKNYTFHWAVLLLSTTQYEPKTMLTYLQSMHDWRKIYDKGSHQRKLQEILLKQLMIFYQDKLSKRERLVKFKNFHDCEFLYDDGLGYKINFF